MFENYKSITLKNINYDKLYRLYIECDYGDADYLTSYTIFNPKEQVTIEGLENWTDSRFLSWIIRVLKDNPERNFYNNHFNKFNLCNIMCHNSDLNKDEIHDYILNLLEIKSDSNGFLPHTIKKISMVALEDIIDLY